MAAFDPFALFTLVFAVVVVLVGFEYHRRYFVKHEFLLLLTLALASLLTGFAPQLYDAFGRLLGVERRPVILSVLANGFLLFLSVYLLAIIRETRGDVSTLTRRLAIREASADNRNGETVYVVVPAFNEASSIRSVVSELPEHVLGFDLVPVIVSDGSTDGTFERADVERSIVVEHPLNLGQGNALKTGFDIALEHDADVVVTMDGDGQHPIAHIEDLLEPIDEDRADYVIGSRYIGDDRSGNGPVRTLGIRALSRLINVLTKLDVTDCTNGYRAIRGADLGELSLVEGRFSAPELLIEARKNGLRISEVPVTIEERQFGESKKPRLWYAIGLFRTIVITWLR